MISSLTTLVQALSTITPLGIAALLIVVILLMIHPKGPIKMLANNHLEHVQASLDILTATSTKQLDTLSDIRSDISYVKGKLDR